MSTVKEVIEKLSKCDPNLEVFAAKDEEGNGYNEVDVYYIGESYWVDDGYEGNPVHPDDVDSYDLDELTRL